MASRPSLSALRPSDAAISELARRVALAREPRPQGPVSRPPWRRFVGEGAAIAEPLRRPFRRIAVKRASNPRTIMVLPGFATHPVRMRYLSKHLARAGHSPKQWGLGWNLGASEENFAAMEKRLIELRRRSGEPIVLLGWSLGGIFARELAKRHPHCVRKVITMGSPFSGDPRSNNVWRAYQFIAGHSVDNPPVEADVAVKPPVETIALWSPRDGVIAPRSASGMPHERDRAIALRCTHMGFIFEAEAIRAVLSELDQG